MIENMDLMERYEAGRKHEVWSELRQLGGRVWEPEHREIAWEICSAACEIQAENLRRAVEIMRRHGYEFATPGPGTTRTPHDPIVPPGRDTPAFVDWLEDKFGPIGMLGRAFVQLIGDVNLNGILPAWGDEFALVDPFMFEVEAKAYGDDVRRALLDEYELYAEDDNEAEFGIAFAPDDYHKANISGAGPYLLRRPAEGVDSAVEIGGSEMGLVDYLNRNLAAGFFPGLDRSEGGLDTTMVDEIIAVVKSI